MPATRKLQLKPSTVALFVCCLAIFIYQCTGNINRALTWDIFGYYLYLPSAFIQPHSGLEYHEWLQSIMTKYEPSETLYQVFQIPNGQWINRYTMGMAILMCPFFFIAHFVAPLLGYPQDGFSFPYQFCEAFGTLIFSFIGLYFLRKVLLRFVSEKVTSITLLLLVFATNYMQMAAECSMLTHGPAFCIVSLMLWCTIKWHEKQSLKYAFFIGALSGLALILRPTELLVAMIPLLWGIKNRSTLDEKFRLLKTHWPQIIVAIIVAFLVASPQAIFWHAKSGEWIFNSYNGNPGEGLDLNKPHLFKFLFSFQKGWLIYTPIMWFAITGFINLYRKNRTAFFPLLSYFILSLWITSCWTIWWYGGGSFSPRAIMPIYPVMAIPFGYFIARLVENRKKSNWILWSIIGLLTILNLFQTWQYKHNIINRECMTFAYYVRIFGKTSVTDEDKKLLLPDRINSSFPIDGKFTIKTLGKWDFEEPDKDSTVSFSGKRSLKMNESIQFSPGIKIPYNELTSKSYVWIRSSVKFYVAKDYHDAFPVLVTHFTYKDQTYSYVSKELKPEEVKAGEWNDLKLDYITPYVRDEKDILHVYVWYRGHSEIYIDDLKINFYEPKEDK